MNQHNVLVFPCGSEIGLEVHRALAHNKLIRLFGASSVQSPGRLFYENCFEDLPSIADEGFMSALNAHILTHEIDFLVPAYDDVILYLSERRDELLCRLLAPSYETCRICRSKKETYALFSSFEFTPKVYNYYAITQSDLPLFAKPDIGQGSQGTVTVLSMEQLQQLAARHDEYVFCELLAGEEYTVDCFTDRHGTLQCASVRERMKTKMGIAVESKILNTPYEILEIADTINGSLSLHGVWFFQVKKDSAGAYRLLEVAPRVAGSMGLSRVAGFNFILNALFDALGHDISRIENPLHEPAVSRSFDSRYEIGLDYDCVYLDFDDTIIVNDTVNLEVISLLYQCRNNSIPVILLTRHKKDIYTSLEHYALSPSLFAEIHMLKDSEEKSSYIKRSRALFIDDSFSERLAVSRAKRIPVFDIDAVGALIDLRS